MLQCYDKNNTYLLSIVTNRKICKLKKPNLKTKPHEWKMQNNLKR